MANKKPVKLSTIFIIMVFAMIVLFFSDKIPFIKDILNYILDPIFGTLLNWNLYMGMIIIITIISVLTTLVQKYATDQDALKELKKLGKEMQKEMQMFQKQGNTQKMMELQKEQFKLIPKTMTLSLASLIYTMIPFLLFFIWFRDFFEALGDPLLFGLKWIWFYFISFMILGTIIRKALKVV